MTHRRTPSVLARLRRQTQGLTSMEFAIIAPVLLLLTFGVLEFAMIMLVTNMMESATAISSRLGKTGYAAAGVSREATILSAIEERAGVLIDASRLTIRARFYEQFDQIGDAEPWHDANGNGIAEVGEYTDINGNGMYDTDMGTAGYGDAEDIVVYEISYPWDVMTPMLREMLGENGTYTITTHAVVKNEPY